MSENARDYLIGEFEIDVRARRVRRLDGGALHLPKRPFQVLLYLVSHRDRIVTRDELLDRFWDGRDVYDAALTRCVSSLRAALDDRRAPARFIETRWAEGYRFVGPCEEIEPVPARARGSTLPRRGAVVTDAGAPREAEALAVVGTIYDAALDPDRWPEALERICGFLGGIAAALTSQNMLTRQGRFLYSWGDDPHFTQLYFERYVALNPCLVPLMLLGPGEVCSASTLLPTAKFRTTRFYKEWAGPQGYGDNTAAVIEKTPAIFTFLGVSHRDEDSPVGGPARQRMSLLVPHVRRAVAIADLLNRQRVEADALAAAVDAIAAGVFLLRDGFVVHANASGRAMLEAGTMLRLDEGLLVACGEEARRTLAATIAAGGSSAMSLGHGEVVPLRVSNGDRYVAHVLPLALRRRPGRDGANMAVFVHKAALEGLLPVEAVARQFRLSPAELRVLVALIETGGRVSDIAPMLALTEPTVKTHLRRLFAKTGTARQTDLVRMVAGYANPLLPQP